jgi:hypothetical protein
METGDDKKPDLKIVSTISSEEIDAKRALADARRSVKVACEDAAQRLHRLTANLLRIIAGAGEPGRLLTDIDEARTTYIKHSQSLQDARACGEYLRDDISTGLDIDELFKTDEHLPQTEEEWRRWQARADDPFHDYSEESERTKRHLRRSVLREVAANLTGIDVQSRKHSNDIDDAVRRLVDLREDYLKRRDRPAAPNPIRARMVEEAIADIRKTARQKQIAGLPSHQIKGLRVIASGSFERIDTVDGFTLDVLGRMGLLKRIKGKSGKRGWELTDDGRAALEYHDAKASNAT